MQLTHPVEISLLDFIRTGKFDFVRLGKTKQWLAANFPDPDDTGPDGYASAIWRYGNIEFHFHGEILALIFSDYVNELSGGPHLLLDKWLFADPGQLTLGNVARHLARERIGFQLAYAALPTGDSSATITATASNVRLRFGLEQQATEGWAQYLTRLGVTDGNLFRLFSISLSTL